MRRTTTAHRRSPLRAVTALSVLLALAGCTPEVPESPPPVTQAAEIAVEKVAPPAPVVPLTWPLTGVVTPEAPTHPALAVKIENPREVRPQTGIEAADVVWEQVVEGGVTRFVAVYHSSFPPEVGPIRSVRPMDAPIAAPLHGVIAFSGGQPRFVRALADAGLQVVSHDAGDPGFYRRSGLYAPHNVFGDPKAFLAQADAEHAAPPAEQFRFARRPEQATVPAAGAPAGTLSIRMSGYSQPGWTWDAPSAAWLRTESGVPASGASGARIAATNVVAVRVDLVDSGTRDPSGAVVPETRLLGSGTATVATGGRVLDVTWSKESVTAPLQLTTADGQPVLLAPGKTWVELVPNSSGAVTAG